MSLGMDTGRTLADAWLDEDEGGPAEGLLDIAAVHESGVRVAALVSNPLAMTRLDPERVAEALMAARWGVDVIVVDLHPSYSEVNQVDLRASPTGSSCRSRRTCRRSAPRSSWPRSPTELGHPRSALDRRQPREQRRDGRPTSSAPSASPAIAQIRSGGMLFVRAANVGRTVIDLFPREKVAGDFEALADRLLGIGDAGAGDGRHAGEQRSLLGGLFRGKEAVRA